jgi:Zc3h12a-like Ribonuclease NYN domain
MPARHVVVDGSNMATEGNSLPSLKQLDEAVREFLLENPDDIVTVVVDATFGHRIPTEERERFEQAELAGEIVSPPAGAIGRGDAFLLRVADKVGAVVLSNDSFQEFHGEYEWLFDKGRLIGGKPVPGVGWIFTPRTPVRGPKSRESVKEAKRKRHAEKVEEPAESGLDMAAERSRGHGGDRKLQRAIAAAVEEAVEPAKGGRKRRRRRRGGEVPSEPLNEPFNFITFIAAHQLGDEVEGTVDEFASHGAFISVDGARCYLPLSAMGEVAPRSAREVLRKAERRGFVVQAFDAMRRGIELALPGFARPAGSPTAETIDAEIHRGEPVTDGSAPGADGAALEFPEPVGVTTSATGVEARGTGRTRPGSTGPGRVAASRRSRKSAVAPEAPGADAPAKDVAVRPVAGKRAAPRAGAAVSNGVTGTEPGRARRSAKKLAGETVVKESGTPATTAGATTTGDQAQPARPTAVKGRPAGTKVSVRKEGAAKKVTVATVATAKTPAPKAATKRAPAKRQPATKEPVAKETVTKETGPAKKQPSKKAVKTAAAATTTSRASGAKTPGVKSATPKTGVAKTAVAKTSSPARRTGPGQS